MNIEDMSIEDLAIYLSDYLRINGIDTVLSGGACVTIYTGSQSISYDLNFVLLSSIGNNKIAEVLTKIGFNQKGRYFCHDKTLYFIDFLLPPLSIGEDAVKEVSEIIREGKVLKLLSATDCVRDRLAAFYYWNDRQSLEQALLVCQNNQIDLNEVKRWSITENMENRFNIFKEAYAKIHEPE